MRNEIKEILNKYADEKYFDYQIAEIENPDFSNIDKCHDWKNYIPDKLTQRWNEISTETRVVAFLLAEEQASNEEWE